MGKTLDAIYFLKSSGKHLVLFFPVLLSFILIYTVCYKEQFFTYQVIAWMSPLAECWNMTGRMKYAGFISLIRPGKSAQKMIWSREAIKKQNMTKEKKTTSESRFKNRLSFSEETGCIIWAGYYQHVASYLCGGAALDTGHCSWRAAVSCGF